MSEPPPTVMTDFSCRVVAYATERPTMRIGRSGQINFHRNFLRFHQRTRSNPAGSVQTTVLLEQRGEESEHAQCVEDPAARCVGRHIVADALKAQVSEGGQKIEQTGERVFSLGNPRDGFHLNRMDRPEKRPEPGRFQAQAAQRAPEDDRAARVEHHVDDVIAQAVQAPAFVLDPESCEDERVVMEDLERRVPDGPETIPCMHGAVADEPEIIIPRKVGMNRGEERDYREQKEKKWRHPSGTQFCEERVKHDGSVSGHQQK